MRMVSVFIVWVTYIHLHYTAACEVKLSCCVIFELLSLDFILVTFEKGGIPSETC